MVADANQDKTSELGWLDELLVDKSPEFQAKVLRWTVRMNIKPKEPLFLTLVAIGQLQALLEDSPKDLSSLFDQWSEQLYDNLKEAERVAVKGQQTAISSAVATLLRKTQWEQATKLSAILPAAGLLTVAIGFGTLIGLGVSAWLQSQVDKDPTGPRQLTLEQAESLRWAESNEGKFARNLIRWNAGSLDNLDCKNDVKRLGVTLEIQGRKATEGFCTIWVVSPEKRKFRSVERKQ
jgi:hypothetical protein